MFEGSLLASGDQHHTQHGGPQHDRSEGERLQKVARAGLGSRRACEKLIEERRVEVDGRAVREQGLRVESSSAP